MKWTLRSLLLWIVGPLLPLFCFGEWLLLPHPFNFFFVFRTLFQISLTFRHPPDPLFFLSWWLWVHSISVLGIRPLSSFFFFWLPRSEVQFLFFLLIRFLFLSLRLSLTPDVAFYLPFAWPSFYFQLLPLRSISDFLLRIFIYSCDIMVSKYDRSHHLFCFFSLKLHFPSPPIFPQLTSKQISWPPSYLFLTHRGEVTQCNHRCHCAEAADLLSFDWLLLALSFSLPCWEYYSAPSSHIRHLRISLWKPSRIELFTSHTIYKCPFPLSYSQHFPPCKDPGQRIHFSFSTHRFPTGFHVVVFFSLNCLCRWVFQLLRFCLIEDSLFFWAFLGQS